MKRLDNTQANTIVDTVVDTRRRPTPPIIVDEPDAPNASRFSVTAVSVPSPPPPKITLFNVKCNASAKQVSVPINDDDDGEPNIPYVKPKQDWPVYSTIGKDFMKKFAKSKLALMLSALNSDDDEDDVDAATTTQPIAVVPTVIDATPSSNKIETEVPLVPSIVDNPIELAPNPVATTTTSVAVTPVVTSAIPTVVTATVFASKPVTPVSVIQFNYLNICVNNNALIA